MSDWESFKASFWKPGESYGVLAPLTDELVHRAESTLGVTLPTAYIELLRIQNGGPVADDYTAHPSPRPTSWAEDHVSFPDLRGIGDVAAHKVLAGAHFGEPGGILNTPYLLREWEMPHGLVLLSGDGHWWLALDYRSSGPEGAPSVIWYDTDEQAGLELAPDFRSFLGGLCNEEATYGPAIADDEPIYGDAWARLSFYEQLLATGEAQPLVPHRQSDDSLRVPLIDRDQDSLTWTTVRPGAPEYSRWLAKVEGKE
jgi:cell wall assembly regulator SMI1